MRPPLGMLPLGSIAGGRFAPLLTDTSAGGSAMSHIFIDAAGMRRGRTPVVPARRASPSRFGAWVRALLGLRVTG